MALLSMQCMFLSLTAPTMLHAVKVAIIVPMVRKMERERKKTIMNSRVKLAAEKASRRMEVRTSEGEKRTETSEDRRRVLVGGEGGGAGGEVSSDGIHTPHTYPDFPSLLTLAPTCCCT